MNRIRISAKALLLAGGIGIAPVTWAGSAPAAVQPSSTSSSSDTIVIRGSSEMTTPPSSGDDPPPVVLRGSRPPPAVPPADYACPAGYLYDPSSGCVMPGYAYEPYGYDYWPYWGFDGFSPGTRRHRFAHGFARRAARVSAVRFAHPAVNGFGHGFAHLGGFAHTGGFGHR
jgi:hypothetical protein